MKVALVGNPNTGKSSIFNLLTGLRQHVGNFPGITVDKKVGKLRIGGEDHELIDLPGAYSIYPRSKDEQVVYDSLSDSNSENYPDAIIVVVDAANLERNLLLFSQVYDLGIPTMMVLNMTDLAKKQGKVYHIDKIEELYPEASILEANARAGFGKSRIKEGLENLKPRTASNTSLAPSDDLKAQEQETESRFKAIQKSLSNLESKEKKTKEMSWWEKLLVHPILGYVIFAVVLIVIFQFIYAFASIPMDLIDGAFANWSSWMSEVMPAGVFTDLVTQGIIPGIGGVVIFIPQIALLFFFIAILEETGYLARVVFIMDRLMRPLGLNGKSVVPLMSSVACAIPGVMAARTISDWKERLITILVAPLMSCSARIPVYTLLIAIVIPDETVFGFMNVQGLVLFGLYMLGTIFALIVAVVLKFIIRSKEQGFLMLELPEYKSPRWKNVGLTVWEKVRIFVWDAGRVILAISIILWAMASYGPTEQRENAVRYAKEEATELNLSIEETSQLVEMAKLESSYIGYLGKAIEPIIEPLGYDWKIGISLITSFAAREVFVGSMATIYAVEDDGANNMTLVEKMKDQKRCDGTPVYTLAAGSSLMVFYVFAMMCMATLAVVKRETKSWKWPLIQVGYMGVLAYLGAWITFIILS
ncbi:ferrous iron transporter B [Crocinitomicaceae bacterium]|nr:ferrous iron transporter B [Crocinitomicaceae bacterium]MDC1283129.1 ferrous iron transporter B [Crocinitomicaceae bacterium]MDC1385145.1 ferrous iron transporter B [Crocinitomicaceae bacterium]|tara:strand:- start:59 stop:1993 length:1935 start_codon:yes stop_codon:yes gene_type:complete